MCTSKAISHCHCARCASWLQSISVHCTLCMLCACKRKWEGESAVWYCDWGTHTPALLREWLDVRGTLPAYVTVLIWEVSDFLSLLLKIDHLLGGCLHISGFHINEKITADTSLSVWCPDQKGVCENRLMHFDSHLILLCVWILFHSVRVTADNVDITHHVAEKGREDSIDMLKSIQTVKMYLRCLWVVL